MERIPITREGLERLKKELHHIKRIERPQNIRAIEEASGKKAITEMKPMQAGDVVRTWANVDGLGEDFNYKPICSIENGIKNFMGWYTNFNKQQ